VLQAKDYPTGSAIYSFVDAETGENTHVDSEKLRQWCAANKASLEILLTPVDPQVALGFLEGNVIDLAHVARVQKMPKLDPIIYGKVGTLTNGHPDVLLIDGHHRFFLAYAEGEPFIPAYILEPAQWQEFKIEGLPNMTEEQLRAKPGKAGLMAVTRTSPMSGEHTLYLNVTQEQLDAYARGGILLQHAFPQLTPPEREFIKTGYTQEDWDKLFPPEDR